MLISGYSNGEFVIPLVFNDKGMVVFPFNERQIVAEIVAVFQLAAFVTEQEPFYVA